MRLEKEEFAGQPEGEVVGAEGMVCAKVLDRGERVEQPVFAPGAVCWPWVGGRQQGEETKAARQILGAFLHSG